MVGSRRRRLPTGVRLVVGLQRIAIDVVLDPNALRALFQVAEQFAAVPARDTPVQSRRLAKKTQHVRAPKGGDRVAQQGRIESPQVLLLRKSNIYGPLALVRGPVVVYA